MGRKGMLWTLTITLCLALTACGPAEKGAQAEQLALEIRGEYLAMTACNTQVEVTADYGSRVFSYSLDVDYHREGETVLTVTAPEEIAGVTARMWEDSSVLEYDGVQVETGAVTEDGLSPMAAVPLMLEQAGAGFIAQCGLETLENGEVLRVVCRDPEGQPGEGVECTLWFQPETHALVRGELSQDGYTVLTCTFTQFQME